MNRRPAKSTYQLLAPLVIAAIVICGGAGPARAQSTTTSLQSSGLKSVTDASGASQTYNSNKRIPPAQRQAAAASAVKRGLKPGVAGRATSGTRTLRSAATTLKANTMGMGGSVPTPHYFGPFANYANSPLPKGPITSITVDSGGNGLYSSSPTVIISDVYGTGSGAKATATVVNGMVSAITVTNPGANYSAPIVTITDSSGADAAATAVIGGTPGSLAGGLRKFVDRLPGLNAGAANHLGQYIPVAIPDTTTYPGSDYYEIELGQYNEQLHSDLPGPRNPNTPGALGTTLRGYRQTNTTDPNVSRFHYLGPLILARKNVPVRVKFTNKLGVGTEGDLFLPVDTTVMGAGMGPQGGMYTQNRATVHLHGGLQPWISDGTPHQWTTPANENTPYPKGVSVSYVPDMWFDPVTHAPVPAGTPGATNDPGDGSMTFYYTNQQSARLLFYHDHAWGITRLNVYAGEAAGYLITDQVEQDLINGTNVSGVNPGLVKVLPDAGLPLIIQDRTFVDASTIAAQDPNWRWGLDANGMPVTGSLWLPSVYMPAQNPWDLSGTNAFGRWMYGPWFWPPTTGIEHPPIANPYYDANCDASVKWCEPPMIPDVPSPSMGMEAFMDTPLVNGTAYPYMEVQPKAYRFRILNAADDRFVNLQMYVADSTVTTSDGRTNTEVKMVPAIQTQGFPAKWPSDGRAGGVPDPATAGPSWIQIGTDAGFLPKPVVVPNQPVTWNMNATAFNFGNVQDHSLLLGPAERADVIVDFSQYAGKTLIVYNDAPAAFPALDPRYDYYTGDPNQMDTGGAPTTQPGYGPNTRTIMQIRVAAEPATPYNLDTLNAVFAKTQTKNGVFETSQNPIIVPQAAYSSAYNATNFPADTRAYVQIHDTSKTFTPMGSTTPVTINLEPKAIHDEMGAAYDTKYGRMSGMLGLELRNSSNLTQNILLSGYASPPVEILQDSMSPIGTLGDGTQLWQIIHNGVDTHPVHFHLFDVQLINRVAWDGVLIPPDPNELGWKDTVRVNPLEQTIVAMRPKAPTVPFDVPNSVRLIDPMMPEGAPLETPPGGLLDPAGNAVTVMNHKVNFGWEYVWHCHILSHEEMDMMHAMGFAVAPRAPSGLTVTRNGTEVQLSWTDNSVNETSFTVQRADDSGFTTGVKTFPLPENTTSYSDTTANPAYYRVFASNTIGDTQSYAGASFPTTTLDSGFSNTVEVGIVNTPVAGVTPASLRFATQIVNSTSAAQVVTLSNTGNAPLTISGIAVSGTDAAEFAQSNNCGTSLAAPIAPATSTSCTIQVTFRPTAVGERAALLTISTNDPMNPTAVSLSGEAVGPVVGLWPTAVAFGNQLVAAPSAAQTITVSNTGTASLTINSIGVSGANPADFAIVSNACVPAGGAGTLAAGANCAITLVFTPAATGGRSASLDVNVAGPATSQSVPLSGTGVIPVASLTPRTLAFGVQLVNTTSAAQSVALSNGGLTPLAINSIAIAGANPGDFLIQSNTCGATLVAGAGCGMTVSFKPLASAARSASLVVASNDPANPSLTVALSGTGSSVTVSSTALLFGTQVVGSTSASQAVTLLNVGPSTLTISGIAITGGNPTDFGQTTNCGASLAAGQSCRINVTFTPTASGARTAVLSITDSDSTSPQTVTLGGTGSVLGLTPASLTFNSALNVPSAPQTVTVTNTSAVALTISSITLNGATSGQFTQTNNCVGQSIPMNGTCTVNVTFRPTSATPTTKSQVLNVNVNTLGISRTVTLSGTVTAPTYSISTTSLAFGTQPLHTATTAQTLTVTNTGASLPLTITGITIAGTNRRDFAQTSSCAPRGWLSFPVTLAPGATCSINVTFAPNAAGSRSGTLNVSVAAPATPISTRITLTGTGQ